MTKLRLTQYLWQDSVPTRTHDTASDYHNVATTTRRKMPVLVPQIFTKLSNYHVHRCIGHCGFVEDSWDATNWRYLPTHLIGNPGFPGLACGMMFTLLSLSRTGQHSQLTVPWRGQPIIEWGPTLETVVKSVFFLILSSLSYKIIGLL